MPTWAIRLHADPRRVVGLVLPALLLNYAGQTADRAVERGGDRQNLFFLLAPSWALYPLVVLATLATIIASQAIITGRFSLTRQAMQLGWLPECASNRPHRSNTARSTCRS